MSECVHLFVCKIESASSGNHLILLMALISRLGFGP